MASVKQFQVTFDCAEPERVARFWCEVLGYVVPPPPDGFATWADFDRALPPERQGSAFACVDPSGASPWASHHIAERLDCPLIVDEAYVDFARSHCVGLVADHPNVIVLRTLSKGYSLAGLRLGYLIAQPDVIAGLIKVKDSYNCGTLSLLGGQAALEDQDYLAQTRGRILATRQRLTDALRALGYHVPESQANFVWCTEGPPAASIYEALKERKILVRLMRYPGLPDGLRITVGTDEEIDALLDALRRLV